MKSYKRERIPCPAEGATVRVRFFAFCYAGVPGSNLCVFQLGTILLRRFLFRPYMRAVLRKQ